MPVNFDVDLLKTFIAIAELGSFTKAAAQVNKTQSAVSMQMKRLEEMLGRPVFKKQGRSNTLTTDGQRLLEHAYRIAKLNDEAVSSFQQPDLTGIIRLGTPEDYADCLLPGILARFARSHPLVQIDVECNNSAALADQVRNRDLDLAIITAGDYSNVETIIRREQLVWVTARNQSPHEQDVIPVALSHMGCYWRKMALDALDDADKAYRIAYASSNSSAIATMVLSGLAIAAIPKLNFRQGMRRLTEADGFADLGAFDIGLLRADAAPNCAIDAFATHITESFGNLGNSLIAAE